MGRPDASWCAHPDQHCHSALVSGGHEFGSLTPLCWPHSHPSRTYPSAIIIPATGKLGHECAPGWCWQVKTHAQKYFLKLARQSLEGGGTQDGGSDEGAAGEGGMDKDDVEEEGEDCPGARSVGYPPRQRLI